MRRIIALLLLSIAALSPSAYAEVVNNAAICYHAVTKSPLELAKYTISEKELEEDIKYFTKNGTEIVTPSEMYHKNKKNSVILTFDDGYEDFYTVVFPLLKKYNVKAVVYIISSRINKKGYLKDWQIKELDASGLVEIGNHTHIIHMYPYRKQDYANSNTLVNDFVADAKECDDRLKKILGHGIESLAYPSGQYTAALDKAIRTKLGYTTTFATDFGIIKNNTDMSSPMRRVYHEHEVTTQEVAQRINRFK